MAERWFVLGHEATNSGAPRMLLRVLQGVRARRGDDWSCEIVLRYGGPLVEEFAALGRVRVLASRAAHGRTLPARVVRRLVDLPWLQPRRFSRVIARCEPARYDLVYNNTATNGALIPFLRRLGRPVLTHVHELGASMRRFNSPTELAATLAISDRLLAVSPAVSADLIEAGARAERITVLPNFLTELPEAATAAAREAARLRLGVPTEAKLVVGCGHIDRVKGTDLFLDLANALVRRGSAPWSFVWVGGETDVRFARQLRARMRRDGLERWVRFVGPAANPLPWFTAADVVAVTSRAESFSLVALEASALGRPVIGFAGSRGLGFVLDEAPGLLASGFAVEELAVRAERLLASGAEAMRVGSGLRARVAAEFLAPAQVERILGVTDDLRQRAPTRGGANSPQ